MGDRRLYLSNQIVKYSNWLHEKGYVANHDGNISAKFENGLLATPTAVSKGDIVADMIIALDMQGQKTAGIGKPFSEIKLHLAAYETRNGVQAVVHAHPPFATARGLANLPLYPMLPEAVISIGDHIPVLPFTMPGTSESIDVVRQAALEADVFIIPGNGVLALGDDVEQAYLRLELVEHVAKIQFYADQMGGAHPLSAANVSKLLEKRASIGLGPQNRNIAPALKSAPTHDLKSLIAAEIKKALQE